jgi:nucleotide-binding universal stress UspA family protein
MYKHILLPYDGSELSDKALSEAIGLARGEKAKLTLLYVVGPHHLMVGAGSAVPGQKRLEKEYMEKIRTEAAAMLDAARQRAVAAGLDCVTVLEDGINAYENIIETANRDRCDLILMASHGRRGLEGMIIGSQTNKVLTRATVPVLVVR